MGELHTVHNLKIISASQLYDAKRKITETVIVLNTFLWNASSWTSQKKKKKKKGNWEGTVSAC